MNDNFEKVINCVIVGSVACLVLGFSALTINSISFERSNKTEIVTKIEDKPSYEYLKSVTVYIVNNHPEQENFYFDDHELNRVSIGTGTIVANKDGYFYIMTNKHVCNIEDKDNCSISLNGDPSDATISLTYVREAKEDIDLSLWKVLAIELKGKTTIKGLNIGYIQNRVFSVGQYLGKAFIYSEGTFAGYGDGKEIFNLPSAPGCSGSGIFNSNGELIAVLYAGSGVSLIQWPIGASMDTSKALAQSGSTVKEFLGSLINE